MGLLKDILEGKGAAAEERVCSDYTAQELYGSFSIREAVEGKTYVRDVKLTDTPWELRERDPFGWGTWFRESLEAFEYTDGTILACISMDCFVGTDQSNQNEVRYFILTPKPKLTPKAPRPKRKRPRRK